MTLDAAPARRPPRRSAASAPARPKTKAASLHRHRHSSNVTFTDLFCGAGGSSTGLVNAGFDLVLAANHNKIAISTHAANHVNAEHLCADINHYDMRRLPRTRVLWASPICTEVTPAGGKRRRARQILGQEAIDLEQYGAIDTGEWERTRATAYDVIRATEVHRYDVVIVENVVEFLTDWELSDWWFDGMVRMAYDYQIVSASSAHLGGEDNLLAPQYRDRIYIVFTRTGIRQPDLSLRPLAWCFACGCDVEAVQTWRNGRTVGKYKQQYDFRCPNSTCDHAIVEPYVRPAASVIDWSNPGTRIGDRKRPLVENTMARIRAGLEMFCNPAEPSGDDGLLVPCGGQFNTSATSTRDPMRTRMANPKGYEGLLTPPFVVEYRNHASASSVDEPLAAITGQGNHHGLVVPDRAFVVKNYGGHAEPKHLCKDVAEPFGTVTTSDHHALVIPYRNALPTTTATPLHTLSTKDSAALVRPAVDIDDCYYRMLQPREQLSAQRFPEDYIVHGNQGQQTVTEFLHLQRVRPPRPGRPDA